MTSWPDHLPPGKSKANLARSRDAGRAGWQRIGNQIDAAMVFARVNFVKVRRDAD
jgi:hypothetical protein